MGEVVRNRRKIMRFDVSCVGLFNRIIFSYMRLLSIGNVVSFKGYVF